MVGDTQNMMVSYSILSSRAFTDLRNALSSFVALPQIYGRRRPVLYGVAGGAHGFGTYTVHGSRISVQDGYGAQP